MNRKIASFFALASWVAVAMAQVEYVNPMIGTDGMGTYFSRCLCTFWYCAAEPGYKILVPHNVDGVYQGKAYEYWCRLSIS